MVNLNRLISILLSIATVYCLFMAISNNYDKSFIIYGIIGNVGLLTLIIVNVIYYKKRNNRQSINSDEKV